MARPRRRVLRPSLERLDARCLLSGLTPAQVTAAYGLNAITYQANGQAARGDGTGQTIAVVTAYHDPNLVNDLKVFDRTYGLPDPNVTQVFSPGTASSDSWASEAMLDVEWAHAVAPGANLVVVEAPSDALHDMLAAAGQARMLPGVSVVSMSWGASEFPGLSAYDGYFTTPAGHNGVTFVASTGDASALGGATWPAVSTNVVAVGGTTLRVDGSGRYLGEAAWSSGGSGVSHYEAKPSYQVGTNPYGNRAAADVAAVADPTTGVRVYTTTPSTGRGAWEVVGGTSLAAPVWAGLLAIVNQGRTLIGLDTLDGPSQTLPAIYAAPASSFHDVASGSDGYAATAGYDLPTGRGTPNGPYLVNQLVGWTAATPVTTVVTTASAAPTGTTTSQGGSSYASRSGWSPSRRYNGAYSPWSWYSAYGWYAARGANRPTPAAPATVAQAPTPLGLGHARLAGTRPRLV